MVRATCIARVQENNAIATHTSDVRRPQNTTSTSRCVHAYTRVHINQKLTHMKVDSEEGNEGRTLGTFGARQART